MQPWVEGPEGLGPRAGASIPRPADLHSARRPSDLRAGSGAGPGARVRAAATACQCNGEAPPSVWRGFAASAALGPHAAQHGPVALSRHLAVRRPVAARPLTNAPALHRSAPVRRHVTGHHRVTPHLRTSAPEAQRSVPVHLPVTALPRTSGPADHRPAPVHHRLARAAHRPRDPEECPGRVRRHVPGWPTDGPAESGCHPRPWSSTATHRHPAARPCASAGHLPGAPAHRRPACVRSGSAARPRRRCPWLRACVPGQYGARCATAR